MCVCVLASSSFSSFSCVGLIFSFLCVVVDIDVDFELEQNNAASNLFLAIIMMANFCCC